jgi:uncharacterized protein
MRLKTPGGNTVYVVACSTSPDIVSKESAVSRRFGKQQEHTPRPLSSCVLVPGMRRQLHAGLFSLGPFLSGEGKHSSMVGKPLGRAASAAMLGVIAVYQSAIGPMMGKNCRFVPSCSDYFKEAIETYGPTKGAILIAWRLLRCNPAGGSGYDPVAWPPVGFRAGS